MRITHRRKKEEPKRVYRYNEAITEAEMLVLDKSGANLGVMKTAEAMRLAREGGLDLVEINPKTTPKVAKIVDFGQFRYTQEKEARLAKAHQHVVEIKGVRLSLRIGKHDLEIRKNQALKFLEEGDKIKIEIFLRGREMQQGHMAVEVMKNFIAGIQPIMPVRLEQNVERNANKVTALIARI